MSAENNGGKTGYYDLPLPDKKQLEELLTSYLKDIPSARIHIKSMVLQIQELCPQTLNDLIEYKEMEPWQHECFKANYALKARAEKNGGSIIREINKMAYYTDRGLKLAEKALENAIAESPVPVVYVQAVGRATRAPRDEDGALIEATQEMLDAIRATGVNSEEQTVAPKVSLASKDLFHDVTSLNGHRIIHTPTGFETCCKVGSKEQNRIGAMQQIKEKLRMRGIELVED